MGETGEVAPDDETDPDETETDEPEPDEPEPASSRSQGNRPIPGFHIPCKHCM
jgi:hypothetical protein